MLGLQDSKQDRNGDGVERKPGSIHATTQLGRN